MEWELERIGNVIRQTKHHSATVRVPQTAQLRVIWGVLRVKRKGYVRVTEGIVGILEGKEELEERKGNNKIVHL